MSPEVFLTFLTSWLAPYIDTIGSLDGRGNIQFFPRFADFSGTVGFFEMSGEDGFELRLRDCKAGLRVAEGGDVVAGLRVAGLGAVLAELRVDGEGVVVAELRVDGGGGELDVPIPGFRPGYGLNVENWGTFLVCGGDEGWC